jgi:hypothetical protein
LLALFGGKKLETVNELVLVDMRQEPSPSFSVIALGHLSIGIRQPRQDAYERMSIAQEVFLRDQRNDVLVRPHANAKYCLRFAIVRIARRLGVENVSDRPRFDLFGKSRRW